MQSPLRPGVRAYLTTHVQASDGRSCHGKRTPVTVVSDHPIEDRSGGRCTLVEDERGHRIVARLDDLEVPL